MAVKAASPRPLRRTLLRAVPAAFAALAVGCDQGRSSSVRVDAEWHRRALVDGLLARWLEVAPTPSGFMRTAFDRQWKPASAQPGHLTEQARLVYSFVIGYEVTRDARYLEAARRGAGFLLTSFRDPEHGGFFKNVQADGTVLSPGKNTYGHAFALFALSHMHRVTAEPRYREAALAAWQEIDTRMRHPRGGFRGDLPRDFSPAGRATAKLSQNPLMHLFESLLALHDATLDPAALAGAKGLADFVLYGLLVGTADGGAYIPEWFDADWKPLTTPGKGIYIDLGHQFEWIHLLMAAETRGLAGVYAPVADRLLKFAIETGYDDADGGVFTGSHTDGTVVRDKNWWPQCEALRVFLALSSSGRRPDMWRRYEQTLAFVRSQFIDDEHGGWFAKPRNACEPGVCPDRQVEPYHMTGLHHAALNSTALPR